MVLDDGGDDHVVAAEPEPVGEMVDRLGGVAADDGNVVGARPSRERREGVPGLLVFGGGELRLPARPPVDARVPREERLHSSRDRR